MVRPQLERGAVTAPTEAITDESASVIAPRGGVETPPAEIAGESLALEFPPGPRSSEVLARRLQLDDRRKKLDLQKKLCTLLDPCNGDRRAEAMDIMGQLILAIQASKRELTNEPGNSSLTGGLQKLAMS